MVHLSTHKSTTRVLVEVNPSIHSVSYAAREKRVSSRTFSTNNWMICKFEGTFFWFSSLVWFRHLLIVYRLEENTRKYLKMTSRQNVIILFQIPPSHIYGFVIIHTNPHPQKVSYKHEKKGNGKSTVRCVGSSCHLWLSHGSWARTLGCSGSPHLRQTLFYLLRESDAHTLAHAHTHKCM